MENGLAASGVTNTYGNGEGQNTTHFYGGIMNKKKKVKAIKKPNSKKLKLKER